MVIVPGPLTVMAGTKGTIRFKGYPKAPEAVPGTKTVDWVCAVILVAATSNMNTSAVFVLFILSSCHVPLRLHEICSEDPLGGLTAR
jgi:hypothetical protein